jgi:uncharacterized protein (DUF934 family)
MSALIRYVDGEFHAVADDDWQIWQPAQTTPTQADPAHPQTPPAGNWLYPLPVWQAQASSLRTHNAQNARFGLWLAATTSPAELTAELSAPDAQDFAVIALDFPKLADGRAYSLARLLRERLAYTGEIRAVGDVLPDQLFFMWRTGFTAWALRADQDTNAALALLQSAVQQHLLRHAYQGAIIPPEPLFRRRPA